MTKRAPLTKNGFTWGIRSTEIGFMRRGPGEAVLEGSTTSTDCGCGAAKFNVKKPPQQSNPRRR